MDLEREVAAHYCHGALEAAILEALRKSGKDVAALSAPDLSGVDEFHTGGRPATLVLARALGLATGVKVLDVGSGLGGPARTFADTFGAEVVGIDISAEYVEVATSLSRRCGLENQVAFRQASALDIPLPDGAFDCSSLIHVGMNIADKARAFAEVARVLKPGGRFAVYDLMLASDAVVPYPMPWAETAATSYLETPTIYKAVLEQAGFVMEIERDMRDFCLALVKQMKEDAAKGGPPVLGLHLLMGPASSSRLRNVMTTIEAGTLAPVLLIGRKC